MSNNYNAKDDFVCEISRMTLSNQKFSRDNLSTKIRYIWDYLPEIPKPHSITTNVILDPWITYPYDKNLMQEIIEIFTDAGWDMKWLTREAEVDSTYWNKYPKIRFDHKLVNLGVTVEFNDTLIGSTCTRKVVGKEIVEKDIVEFVCNDENNT